MQVIEMCILRNFGAQLCVITVHQMAQLSHITEMAEFES